MAFLKQLRPALVTLAVIFGIVTAMDGIGAGLQLVAISLGAGALAGLISVPFATKSNLVKATATHEMRNATASEFDWLDVATFDLLTALWNELGFEMSQEWVRNESRPQLGVSFYRFLENHEGAALAEIAQIRLPNGIQPVYQTVVSYWATSDALQTLERTQAQPQIVAPLADPRVTISRAEVNENLPLWSIGVTTQKPNWVANILQHPRVMGIRATTDNPSELWERHQQLQAQVSRVLEQKPLQDRQVEIALLQARLLIRIWHARIQKSWAIPLVWRAWRRGTKEDEYWGELEGRI